MLINLSECADNTGMSVVGKYVDAMKANLQMLEQQEEKYDVKLATPLTKYSELIKQAGDVDLAKLEVACQGIRLGKERDAVQQLWQWQRPQLRTRSRGVKSRSGK